MQACRYLVYSEADFEVFRPAGATSCTDGVEIWHGGGDRNGRLSWPGWLTCSGWLTHISGHPSATGRAQDSESMPAKDWCSTAGPRHPPGLQRRNAGKLVQLMKLNQNRNYYLQLAAMLRWFTAGGAIRIAVRQLSQTWKLRHFDVITRKL